MTREEFLFRFYHSPTLRPSNEIDVILQQQGVTPRAASVLIGLVVRDGGLNVILTQRAKHLKHHPGQISFPGGKVEEFDRSPIDTALRETEEEVGISSTDIKVIGSLPPIATLSRFSVTPIIAFVSPSYTVAIDENEVECLFEVPLAFLANPSNMFRDTLIRKHQSIPVFAIPYQQHFIWGVTAQIIDQLQSYLA
ncbi:CoA pyrophosphatase [Vibrio hippocampi]|uniref:Nudix hydrolase NudL n=1 Tax=Vibrio hippocampi TaxID=654686 RepID=A0ABN8DF53_9VIBR|nr:CoA pyrophosphatase [Vibrio hippocampi]CAH0525619.1 putative Nudix hydrolase NudL [Vibrio hippocampi]